MDHPEAPRPSPCSAVPADHCDDHADHRVDEQWVRARRAALGRPTDGERTALALSGGGIRSATFSLGVVQAIAAAPQGTPDAQDAPAGQAAAQAPGVPATGAFHCSQLSAFDYLSTVSGGGYLGGFLCSLFLPGRLRGATPPTTAAPTTPPPSQAAPASSPALQAADDAVAVLAAGAPQRMRAGADYSGPHLLHAPLAWLRENGRYLLPTGSGDALYAMALGLRNWVSLHLVIGTVLVFGVALLLWLRALAFQAIAGYGCWEVALLQTALQAHEHHGSALEQLWWSPLTVLWALPLVTVGPVLGAAYWLVQERPDGSSKPINTSVGGMAVCSLALLYFARQAWPGLGPSPAADELVRLRLALGLGLVGLLSLPVYLLLSSLFTASASRQRVALTRGLALTLGSAAAIAGLGLVDTAGQSLYLATRHQPTNAGEAALVASPAALASALAWLAQRLAKGQGGRWPGFVRTLPMKSLAGAAGLLIFLLIGTLWSMLVHLMLWGGGTPTPEGLFLGTQPRILQGMLWGTLAVALLMGFFPGFINLSSLQPFYGSRLTRAYLGASNGRRFLSANQSKRSAAEPMAGDEVRLSDYLDPATGRPCTVAPLHIINVCANRTVDPAEQLVQRDRKGLPLAVLPCGLALDTDRVSAFPTHPAGQARGWLARLLQTSVDRTLTVGQWIGTSGAAFSTGIGRETTLGMSLLMGAANVRLGTWWSTGRGQPGHAMRVGPAGGPELWLRKAAGLPFRTQRYLSYELRASFHGTNRTWQYLSDGGHFENTGLYELLRPQRRIGRIVASDNGADPGYHFDDLANLIRLARIDLQVEVVVAEPPTDGPLAGLFARPEDFRALARQMAESAAPKDGARPRQSPVAVLLYAWPIADDAAGHGPSKTLSTPPTQIVLIKPLVTDEAPADVRQYALTHPTFPQETTADQFFDEAQWESYRALGHQQARRLFRADVLQALEAARLRWQPR